MDILERLLVRPFREINRIFQLYINKHSVFARENKFFLSPIKINVIIPVVQKDFDVLPYTIKGIQENVCHTISKIIIVSPQDPKIMKYCEDNNFKFINENTVLPIKKSDINFKLGGKDRSGWIFQQFLKYSEFLSEEEHYLTVDADTVLIRPQQYLRNGKTLILKGDDHFPPYARMCQILLGHSSKSALRMVCHQNIFNKTELKNLKSAIEKYTGKIWYKAILDNLKSDNSISFAENMTYAYWITYNHPNDVIYEYFFNKRIDRKYLPSLEILRNKYMNNYKSISFQIYN